MNSRTRLVGTFTFVCGALCGVGGVLGYQTIAVNAGNEPLAVTTPEAPSFVTPAPRALTAAPMPHEPGALLIVPEANPSAEPDSQPAQPPPPPGRVTIIDLGDQPERVFPVPFPMTKGERVVLRGTVKTLRVPALDGGAVLDASGLTASVVVVTGRIDNRSTLKLKAPNGTVHITGKIDGQSTVEIDAREGEVKFMLATTPNREGSKIDNGSTVAVTARTVEFKGDITGTDTKVTATLSRHGALKVATVSGKAMVEYKSLAAGWSAPDITVGAVAGTAVFRKAE